ncbi:hypothetical protein Q0Z83_027350 [Actinoplanes sichuanensis]|uniref:STAS domain-containing protein n=1 Tax=Actinoplanes sichuanensis TaxID=512349 RepID=A0ABW4ATY1_9ACTN|nr:hypothetical protein [Actinoplanes sichuanensis]BEL04544.1 hypothetical protein Q0Z83_027350 [Actinoplanes sichuanensis]
MSSFVVSARCLSELSALQCRFATARRSDASTRDELLLVAFTGTYGAGSGDAVFMRAVLALAVRAFAPAGVVLDLRELDYRSGDMMATVLNDVIVRGVDPAVVVSDTCRRAMTTLVAMEMGEDPAEWLFDSPDEALQAVDARRIR